jgi:hypothetical protein
MKCPKCRAEFTPKRETLAREMGKLTSDAKAKAARLNGKKGGRPKKPQPQPPNPKRSK